MSFFSYIFIAFSCYNKRVMRLFFLLCLILQAPAHAGILTFTIRCVDGLRGMLGRPSLLDVHKEGRFFSRRILNRLDEDAKHFPIDELRQMLVDAESFLGSEKMPDGSPRFLVESFLGAGGFGLVFKGTDRKTGRDLAIKLTEFNVAELKNVDVAMSMEKKLKENNPLLTVFEYAVHGETTVLLSEWLPQGSYADYLDLQLPVVNNKSFATINKSFFVEHMRAWKSLAASLDTLHSEGYLFNDFKPDNFALMGDGQMKLLDIGSLARLSSDNSHLIQKPGAVAIGYRSPELQRYLNSPGRRRLSEIGPPSDVYAYAKSLEEFVDGVRGHTHPQDTGALFLMEYIEKEIIRPGTSPNPSSRPTLRDLQITFEAVLQVIEDGSFRFRNP
jgi:serine/threonine protein kinase